MGKAITTHVGLFEGIGGFSIAAKQMGWETIAWCEINPFCQTVLKYHYPNAQGHEDIKQTDFTIYRGKCDVLTGGFPCQPYSTAGKRLGKEDERHLWPEMLRAIREIAPRWVVGENVRGLLSWNGGLVFEEVQADLETCGYEVRAFVLPAASVNAPHRRDRVWFVGYAKHDGLYASKIRGDEQKPSIKAEQVEIGEFTGASGVESSSFIENTECDGRLCRELEQKGAENGQQRNACAGDSVGLCGAEVAGIVADTINNGLEHSIHGGSEGQVFEKSGRERINLTTEFTQSIEADGLRGYVANSEVEGFSTFCKSECDDSKGREESRGQFEQPTLNVRDAQEPNGWQNFPTQSPLCSGDDGVSLGLSNITFSKWRNESIKALGNAVVPPLVLQIFKAIEKYEQNT